jgi:hypothetical protein
MAAIMNKTQTKLARKIKSARKAVVSLHKKERKLVKSIKKAVKKLHA